MSNAPIPPKYAKPHYSTRLCRANFQYVAKYYDKNIFIEICNELGVPIDYLLKDDNWVSNEFISDLVTRLKAVTGDQQISEKMGRFAISPEVINPIEYAVNQAVLFPALFYIGVNVQYGRYNNINAMKLDRWSPGFFRYHVTPRGEERSSEEVCFNTVGMLTATDRFFGLDEISVTHPVCIHRGGSHCEFEVKYRSGTFWKRKLKVLASAGVFAALSLSAFHVLLRYFGPSYSVLLFLFSVGYSLAGIAYLSLKKYLGLLRYIDQYNEQSRSKGAELYDNYKRLDRKFHESNLLRELSLKLSETVNTKDLLQSCLEELERRFGYSRSLIMLLSAEGTRLYTANARGFVSSSSSIHHLSIKYPPESDNPQLFGRILERGTTTSIFDIEEFRAALKPENQALVDSFEVKSLIVSPIQDKDRKYGILMIGAIGGDRPLSEEDEQLLESISRLLSLSFQTARNFERETSLRTLFQKYVPAVVLEGLNTLAPTGGHLAPKDNIVTSMFVDLRDFTACCERLTPEKVVEMVNLYVDFVTARIASAGGIVDKLVGDGVNAFFPAETRRRTMHARAALVAAQYILADLEELDSVFRSRGFGPACIGIGLHTGPATIGNMGCDRKLDYTAVGDTVNTAARLQELSKTYRGLTPSAVSGVLILTESTFKRAQLAIEAQRIGDVEIRGRAKREILHFVDAATASTWVRETGRNYKQIPEILSAEEDRISKINEDRQKKFLDDGNREPVEEAA